jgi:hypothetical protein
VCRYCPETDPDAGSVHDCRDALELAARISGDNSLDTHRRNDLLRMFPECTLDCLARRERFEFPTLWFVDWRATARNSLERQ